MPSKVQLNFRVKIECKYCAQTFEIMEPAVSLEVIDGKNRLVVIGVPEKCELCHSLHVVRRPVEDD